MGKQGIKKRKKRSVATYASQRPPMIRFIRRELGWFCYGLTGLIVLSMVLMLVVCLTGCGHTITHTDRGTGLVARIPLPDGSSLIDLKIGKIDSTTTVLRGNSTYDSSASTGGTLFGSASTSDRTFVATGMQLNEGYLKDVLTSPDVDPGTKVAIAQAIVQVQASKPKPTVTKAVGAATSTGENPNTEVEPVAVGIDNAVNKVAQVAPKVVTPVADAAKDIVKDTTSTVDSVSKDWKLVWIVVSTAVVVVSGIVAFIVLKLRKKKKEQMIEKDVANETQL